MKNNGKSIYSLEELVGRTVKVTGIIGARKHPSKVIDVTDADVTLYNVGFGEISSEGCYRTIPRSVLISNCFEVVD